MLAVNESKEIQELVKGKHIAALIKAADGYINTKEHVQLGADLGERLGRKAKKGDKVYFAMVNRGHRYIFYFVGNAARICRKLAKLKADA